METDSTSKAATLVHAKSACIGSANLSKLYNLPIIATNIGNLECNQTRFLILGAKTNLDPIVGKVTKLNPDGFNATWHTIIRFNAQELNNVFHALVSNRIEILNICGRVNAENGSFYLLELKGESIKCLESCVVDNLGSFSAIYS